MENQNINEPVQAATNADGEESPIRPAVRSGVILGAISIIISLLIYLIDGSLFANWKVLLVMVLVSLVLVVIFGINYRKQIGGYISFKNAYIYSLVLLIVAGFLGSIFNYVLFNIIDPDLVEVITDASMDNVESFMERVGASQDDIDEALEQVENDTPASFTLGGIFKNFLITTGFYLVLSLLTGVIIRKRNPEEVI